MVVLVFQVFVYLIFGHVIFILIPAIALSQIESNWDYLDAVYFAFITLTTIGFGDFVAGKMYIFPNFLHFDVEFSKNENKNEYPLKIMEKRFFKRWILSSTF